MSKFFLKKIDPVKDTEFQTITSSRFHSLGNWGSKNDSK